MPISEIVTAAPSRGLTTVAAVKARVDTGATPDEILTQQIESWSLRLEALIGRTLARERVKQVDHGVALGVILAERRPIIEVHSITVGDDELEQDRYFVESPGGGLIRIENERDIRNTLLADATPGLSINRRDVRYTIDFTAGFVLPGWPADPWGPRTLPVDIEEAIIEAVGLRFTNASAASGVKSERLGDWSASYSDSISTTGAPASFATIAQAYRSAF